MSELAEPWSTWATQAGVRPSMTGIGEAAGMPASTISRLMRGRSSAETVRAVAEALRVSERDVLAAAKGESYGPWQPPIESHLLTDAEREALSVLIRGLAKGREKISDDRQSEAEKSEYEVVRPNIHELSMGVGARRMQSEGKRLQAEADELGTESQDPEDLDGDPA